MTKEFDPTQQDKVSEIMEAGLGGILGAAGYAGARALGKGVAAGAKALGQQAKVGRVTGLVRAGRALTKIEDDWAHYASANRHDRKAPTQQELMNFARVYYGFDAEDLYRQAANGVGAGSSIADTSAHQPQAPAQKPAAQAQKPQAPQAETKPAEENPAAGRAKKADPAPAQQPEAPAQQQAQQPQAAASAPAAPETPAGPETPEQARAKAPSIGKPGRKYVDAKGNPVDPENVIAAPRLDANGALNRDPSQSTYKHNSKGIDFDDPDLQPNVNPIRSSKQSRDDERLRKPRQESLEFPMGSFSDILAERAIQEADTQSVKSQTVPNRPQSAAIAQKFFKLLASTAASSPRMFKAFMNDENHVGERGTQTINYKREPTPKEPLSQGITPTHTGTTRKIDKDKLNAELEKGYGIAPAKLAELKQQAEHMDEEELLKYLRTALSQDDALRIVAGLLKAVG